MDRRSFINWFVGAFTMAFAAKARASDSPDCQIPDWTNVLDGPDDIYKSHVEPHFRVIEDRVHAHARGRGADVLLGDKTKLMGSWGPRTIAVYPTWRLSQYKDEPGLIPAKAEKAAASIIRQLSHVDLRAIGPMMVFPSHDPRRLAVGYVVAFHVIGPTTSPQGAVESV